jgi:hypothetical protein
MRRLLPRLLLLIPALLIAATLGVWIWRTFTEKPQPALPQPIETATRTILGIQFEIEYQLREGASLSTFGGEDAIGFRRGDDLLDYEDGVLVLNGIGFPTVKPGDVVRWNLEGPLLYNGVPQQPHPHQPRQLDRPGRDLAWEPRVGVSPSPRDTLSVDWSHTGRLLAAACGDGLVRVWDSDRPEPRVNLTPDQPKKGRQAWGLFTAVSPDGKTVASCNMYSPDVVLWDAATGVKIATLSEPAGNVRALRFLTDGWLLEVRGGTLLARKLAGDRSRVVDLGKTHDNFPVPFAVSVDGKMLVRNDGEKATSYRVDAGPDSVTLTAAGVVAERQAMNPVMAVSADGAQLALFNGDNRLAIYDTATGAVKQRLRWRGRGAEAIQITAMCFFPDGKTLAVGEVESLRLYDLDSGRERGWVVAPWVRALAISGDGRTLAAGLRQVSGVRLWEIAGLRE